MNGSDLRVAPCAHDAATYAVMRWHYSQTMPAGRLVKHGIWWRSSFVGVIVYGKGASPNIGNPFGLRGHEVVELVRVALGPHSFQTSSALAVSLRLLRSSNPGLRMVVSFADTTQGHHGGIYQATNWLYVGSKCHHEYEVKGIRVHPKTLHSRYGKGGQSIPWLRQNVDPRARRVTTPPKHKYVMPFDAEMRDRVRAMAKPYPKRQPVGGSGDHPAERPCKSDPGAPPSGVG